MKHKFLLAVFLSVVALGSYGVGRAQVASKWSQWKPSNPQDAKWKHDYLLAEGDHRNRFLQDSIGNRWRTSFIAGNIATNDKPVTAESTSLVLLQNQRLIEQNDEIIRLLKQRK